MNTRYLAVQALLLIFEKGEKPKQVIEELSGQLDSRERSFLMEIVYGVLRHRDYLDWILGKFLEKPSGLPAGTINNLRVAMYQLRRMRVPEWAAVDEAVGIEKGKGGKAALVNAVLRNYLRQEREIGEPDKKDAAKYISVTTSHPLWIVKRWIARLGTKEAMELAMKNNVIPPLTLRIDGDRAEALKLLRESGIEAEKTKFSPAGIIIEGRITPQQIPLDPSSYFIQDEAAQLVSYLLDPVPGEKVLDACAAPGGKTTHIARLMNDEGEVVAVEIGLERLKKIEENISRLGLKSVTIIHGDLMGDAAKSCISRVSPFDKILLDAPCSSTGVIRKNPDVKYRHREKDLTRFHEMQLDLLGRASGYIKKGGIMVYSVCSTEPEEGEEVIRSFLQSHPDFSIIEGAYTFLRHFAYRDNEGHLFYRTWPHREGPEYGMDGFFAARLKRAE